MAEKAIAASRVFPPAFGSVHKGRRFKALNGASGKGGDMTIYTICFSARDTGGLRAGSVVADEAQAASGCRLLTGNLNARAGSGPSAA